METDFPTWLNIELENRQWTASDLARKSGITSSAISRVIAGTRNPGADFCTAIAQALNYSPEYVYRAAGLLPPVSYEKSEYDNWIHMLEQLSMRERDRLYKIGLLMLDEQDNPQPQDDS